MKKTLIGAAALTALTGAGMLMAAAGPDVRPGQASAIAGTYVSVFDYEDATYRATVHINADGTIQCSHQTDFGAIGFVAAPAYGSWEWVGPRAIEGTMLMLCFDAGGTPLGVLQLKFATSFERDLQTAHSAIRERFYAATEDPLNPAHGAPFGPEVVSPVLRKLPAR